MAQGGREASASTLDLYENFADTEGSLLVIGVMGKNPERFADTEERGFEDFKAADVLDHSLGEMRGAPASPEDVAAPPNALKDYQLGQRSEGF